MAYNVVIKRQMAATNIDSYNRSAVHTADLPNGSVFTLNEVDTGNDARWKVGTPTAASKGLWMATSPEVVYVDKNHGGSADPRDFVNVAGRTIDATLLVKQDLVEMTGEGITGISTATFLGVTAGLQLVALTAAPTQGAYLKAVGKGTLKVGDGALAPAAIPTYVFEVVDN